MIISFFDPLRLFSERNPFMNYRRFTFAALCVMVLGLTSACTKKIDGSSMEKYLVSSGEVVKTISGEDRQMEFSNGLDMILFYAVDPYDEISKLDGKTADEVFEVIQQLRDTQPRVDASRKERFGTSLAEVLKSIPNEGTREVLSVQMARYGFSPWNNKNMMNIRSIDGLNAYEINKKISDIRKDEDPTKM